MNEAQHVFHEFKGFLSRNARELRTGVWHYRNGGIQQLKLWRWNQAAQQPTASRKAKLTEGGLRRDFPGLRDAWSKKSGQDKEWAAASETYNYRNVFAQGWILATRVKDLNLPPSWVEISFGEKYFTCDPALKVVDKGKSDQLNQLLVLGQATDSEKKLRSSQEVAQELYSILENKRQPWIEFDEAVTWLGGRFVVIARHGAETRVHVDAMASRSCYWGTSDTEEVVLASHSALVAESVGDFSSTRARWVLNHPEYHNPAGVYLPGTITPFDRAQLVFANCYLSINDNAVQHNRFFPPSENNPVSVLSVEAATEAYLAEVRFQMDVILSWEPRSVFALTSGSDSRAILNASLDLLQKAKSTAMTYHFFEKDADHTRKDLLGANRLAERSGLKHRILNLKPWDPAARFAKLYTKTFPVWARFGALARACYEGLSAKETLIIGVGGEIGTAFYLERNSATVTPEVLAAKFTQDSFQHDPKLIAEFENYMAYSQLDSEHTGSLDLYDLFYWEHRMSSWAAYWYSELDFGPTVALPLNSRRVFCAMLGVPLEDRVRKSVYGTLDSWANTIAENLSSGGDN
ncbi:hypothetical protein SB89_02020 [Corynebacterium glutamicum]|nr:hypothetical protein SB89_02020 [Corynebacterium glutamicum]OKX93069.1 hypothetical protein AUP72_06215 [Corynebacterium glutamicum]TWS33450.1 hypothetical protein AKJ21_12180 [Corynebacterium glutamicum]